MLFAIFGKGVHFFFLFLFADFNILNANHRLLNFYTSCYIHTLKGTLKCPKNIVTTVYILLVCLFFYFKTKYLRHFRILTLHVPVLGGITNLKN